MGKTARITLCLLTGIASLFLMVRLSLDAGISGDEKARLEHSGHVIDYFLSFGKDQTALHTPVTYLKYYGQSFDNFTTLLARIFHIEEIYRFRHICNAFAAWLILLFTFLIGRLLGGRWAGLAAALFLFASPRFLGHSFNNLIDIPFAMGYTSSAYFLLKWMKEWPKKNLLTTTGLILSIAFTISIRPAGLLIICYLWLFALIMLWTYAKRDKKLLYSSVKPLLFISLSGYFLGLLFWPYALENPLWHPIKSLLVMSDYPVTMRQMFEGSLQWSDQLPWYYIYKFILISIPLPVVVLFLSSPAILISRNKTTTVKEAVDGIQENPGDKKIGMKGLILISLFLILLPLIYITIRQSNLYGGSRHLLFIYPLIAAVAAGVLFHVIRQSRTRAIKALILVVVAALFYHPLLFSIRNHPLHYLYYNQLTGGLQGAYGRYEMDYYYHSVRIAAEELQSNILCKNELQSGILPTEERPVDSLQKSDTIIIASNFDTEWYFRKFARPTRHIYTSFYTRGDKDWDYGIFVNAFFYPGSSDSPIWPPGNTLFTVDADGVPICTILERSTKLDFLAYEALKEGKPDVAIELYKQVSEADSGNISAYINLGIAYMQSDKFQLAADQFKRCQSLVPAYEPAGYYLAQIMQKTGKHTEAIRELKDLIIFNPKYLKAYIGLSELYIEEGAFQEALASINQCLEIKPDFKEALQLREELNTIK